MPRDEVVYYYHNDVGSFHYGRSHPMKPQRLTACNDLVVAYGLHKKMKVVQSPKLQASDLLTFHSREYIDFLQKASPMCASELEPMLANFNIGEDCPIFAGMYDYCTLYAGGSVEGARRLNHKLNNIVINWPGGLHHAKKGEASGFCYVNDIVLGILELLKYHKRVLYVDIDIHHGDGVQEAFNNTDRVMTVSFHRYGNFFPGTGSLYDRGVDAGKYFAVNVPLNEGISDFNYQSIFQPVINSVMENFDPEAVVLQCGSDSLGEDRLGSFNLSFDGHAECVRFVKSFRKPMLVVGGGGYTLRNVARCWANETGVCLGVEMPNEIPESALYYQYFTPGFLLKPQLVLRHSDQNSPQLIRTLKTDILECLRQIRGAPSVQMTEIPGIRSDEIEIIERNERKEKNRKKCTPKKKRRKMIQVDESMEVEPTHVASFKTEEVENEVRTRTSKIDFIPNPTRETLLNLKKKEEKKVWTSLRKNVKLLH